MAKKWLDQTGTLGYMNVPNGTPNPNPWPSGSSPTAYDGDGEAIGLAVPATNVIDFTSASAAVGNTIIIAGVTFTAVSPTRTAGTNTFVAGTGSALATAIATAINDSATNLYVNTPVGTSDWCTNVPAKEAFYARSNVSGSATLEIMTRSGSAWYNSKSNFSVTTNITGLTGPYFFTGGASGAWAYFWNPQVIGPMSRSQWVYGTCAQIVWAGGTSPGDQIYVRATTVANAALGGASHSVRVMGTSRKRVEFIFDDGTEWTADAGLTKQFILQCVYDNASRNGFIFTNLSVSADTYVTLKAKRYASGDSTLVIQPLPTLGGNITLTTAMWAYNIDLLAASAPAASGTVYLQGVPIYSQATRGKFVGCRIMNFADAPYVANIGNFSYHRFDMIDCELSAGTGTTPLKSQGYTRNFSGQNTGIFPYGGMGFSGSGDLDINLEAVRFTNFASGSALFKAGNCTNNNIIYRAKNLTLNNVNLTRPVVAADVNYGTAKLITLYSAMGNGDCLTDSPVGYSEWNSTGGYPACNGRYYGSNLPYAVHVVPATNGFASMGSYFDVQPTLLKFNTLADGARTLTVEICVDTTLASQNYTSKDIALYLEYTATDNSVVSINTFDAAETTLTPSTATWTSESGGLVTWGSITLTKYKLVLTTPSGKDLKSNTPISAFVRFTGNGTVNTQSLFIDQEITVV